MSREAKEEVNNWRERKGEKRNAGRMIKEVIEERRDSGSECKERMDMKEGWVKSEG